MKVGRRILLIDDDEPFRTLVAVMLTTAGYMVQEAANGRSGLAAYRQQRSDVVITDILMPEQEGLETIQNLKAFDSAVKIIAMSVTGEGRLGYLQTAMTFGALRTIHKPFSRDELLLTVTEVLEPRRDHQA